MPEAATVDRGDDFVATTPALAPTPTPAPAPKPATVDTEVPEDELPLGEDESPETPEEKAEREKAEAKAEREKNIRIPKHRLDEVQTKARIREEQLLAQIQALQAQQPREPVENVEDKFQNEIDKLQDQYEDAVMDGQKHSAKELRAKIKGMQDQLFEHKTTVRAEQTRVSTIEELQYNATLANVEGTYPELNPDSAAFDDARTQEVGTLMRALQTQGLSRVQALAQAVRYVMPAPTATTASGSPASASRAEAARAKAASANKAQPAPLGALGKDDTVEKIDVLNMSPTRFAKLTPAERAKLRGDDM